MPPPYTTPNVHSPHVKASLKANGSPFIPGHRKAIEIPVITIITTGNAILTAITDAL